MMRIVLAVFAVISSVVAQSQLLTWTPAFPKENEPITITVDATKGNQGLMGFTGNVYVHIGAITNLSTGPSNWLHAPFTWGSSEAAAQATPAGTNKWSFTINNPRTFFNLAANEELKYIAILFRQGGGCSNCAAQRNSDGSDMYVPIYKDDLSVRIDLPAFQPKYVRVPEPQTWTIGSNFSIEAKSNKNADLKLYHNGSLLATQNNAQVITANSTVANLGNQQIIVEANDGTTVKYDTLNIFVSPPNSPVAALPAGVRDGINYEQGDTSAILVLHAPAKSIVLVVGDFNNWTQDTSYIMNKTPDGNKFWKRITGLTPGVEYAFQYRVDDSIKIADPYAQKILDPWNDQYISSATYPNLKPYPAGQSGIVSVLQTNMQEYNWDIQNFNRPDKRGLVIYELLLRDFVANHDWKTLTDTLSYLKRLGINAIELMPFNEFEGNNSWGYNPDFYFAPDKYYGPKNDLKAFIDTCHKNGIAVIMDLTLNHSFGLSPMVQLYWDAANNRPAANNPWFNPAAKHAFNVGYDMNHESLATRYFTSRVVEHWLQEYKIDGFRFDLSKGFTQVQTCDNNGNNCDVGAWGNYDASRIAIWKRYYDTVQLKSPDAYVILEHFAANDEEIVLSNYGMLLWGNLNHNYAEASMGVIANSNFSGAIHSARGWSKPHLVAYMESHDEERIMVRNITSGGQNGSYNVRDTTTALKRVELDAAFFFTIPGPKMIWQFGELGYDYPINYCPDGTVNNNCRVDPKPIRWDYYNQQRRRNLYNVFSRLINLRFHPLYKDAFLSGTVEHNLTGGFKTLKLNSGDTSRLVVIGNFNLTSASGTVTFPTAGTWYSYLDSTTFTATGSPQNINLLPGQYKVFENRNVNNLNVTSTPRIRNIEDDLQVRIFPNPASASFTISLEVPQTGMVNIELLNTIGQSVTSLHNAVLLKGNQQLIFNRESLKITTGNYYLKIKTKTTTKTVQITIQ